MEWNVEKEKEFWKLHSQLCEFELTLTPEDRDVQNETQKIREVIIKLGRDYWDKQKLN